MREGGRKKEGKEEASECGEGKKEEERKKGTKEERLKKAEARGEGEERYSAYIMLMLTQPHS